MMAYTLIANVPWLNDTDRSAPLNSLPPKRTDRTSSFAGRSKENLVRQLPIFSPYTKMMAAEMDAPQRQSTFDNFILICDLQGFAWKKRGPSRVEREQEEKG